MEFPQQPGHAGQRLEMIGARSLRRQQQKQQVNRLAVERLEVDRVIEARKQPEQMVELPQLPVRDGDAVAHGGRAQFFPLQQNLEDRLLVEPGKGRRLGGESLQGLLFPGGLERRNHGGRRDEIDQRHQLSSGDWWAGPHVRGREGRGP